MKVTFGSEVRRVREGRGWAQNALAERAGIPQPTLGRIESGKIPNPSLDIARRLAAALGASLDDLLGGVAIAPAKAPSSVRRSILARVDQLEADMLIALQTARTALALAQRLQDDQSHRRKPSEAS